MAKKQEKQSPPQTMRWLYAGTKRGYNYYNVEERPYNKKIDESKQAAPVGYRFSQYAVTLGITKSTLRKPTKAEIEKYAGKKKNGKLIIYKETRKNKSDY